MKSPYQLYRMWTVGVRPFIIVDCWAKFPALPRLTWGKSLHQVQSKFAQPQGRGEWFRGKRWEIIPIFKP